MPLAALGGGKGPFIMDIQTSSAVILRVKDLGESDLLVSFFTEDRGRLRGLAKGARRSRSRFVNCLDHFCLVRMEYRVRGRGGLHLLNSCRLLNAFVGLRRDFSSVSLASYMVELVETVFPQGVPEQGGFALLVNALQALDEGFDPEKLRVIFEGRAMTLAGYAVDLGRCCLCGRKYAGQGRAIFLRHKGGIACLRCAQDTGLTPGLEPIAVETIRAIQSQEWEELRALSIERGTLAEIRAILDLHMAFRLGERLKTAAYLS